MFRPCIDLHEGRVKQIVGGTLSDEPGRLQTNFVSDRPAAWFAELYRRDGLKGGHVILLGPDNETAARDALQAFPGGLQVGGGVNLSNAQAWLDCGASHVIITSWLFPDGRLDWTRLERLNKALGKDRLVIDLSCRKRGGEYFVVTDKFQTFTNVTLRPELFHKLANSCAEFLVHAVDVEGLCRGVDLELVKNLGDWTPLPMTYAGGARSMEDLETVTRIGQGRVDLTIGSALDMFGGTGVKYVDVVEFNKRQAR